MDTSCRTSRSKQSGAHIKKARLKRFVMILFLANIFLLVSHAGVHIASKMRHRTRHACKENNVGRDQYCFKLDALSCEERGYRVKDGSLCCAHLGNHLYGMLGQELLEKMETDVSRAKVLGTLKNYTTQLYTDPSAVGVRPAAHVGIVQNGDYSGPDSGAPRINWEKSGDTSFVSGGLVHDGDRLRVTKAGYYYVYTGLQYNVDPTTVDTGAIVAYIYRHVNGTRASRRKLMMARESSCKTTRGNVTGPVSVYMAGIFLLRDQDEISVRTHSLSLLNRSPATTYMGLHMV